MTIARSDFIQAVVLQGASTWRILFRHIVPLCLSSVIVRLTLDMAGIILTAAGLGFLGLGAQPPTPEWGAMVSSGRDVILDQWWVATIPGLAIFIVSLGFNLLGDGLRDVFDPKSTIDRTAPHRRRPRCDLPGPHRRHPGRAQGVSSRSAASGSALSASRGRARPPWAAPCSGSCRAPAKVTAKTMSYAGKDLLRCTERDWQQLRGRRMSMVMQDPKYSLNPVKTVGKQIGETCLLHMKIDRKEARRRTLAMLEAVQIRDPELVYRLYPHQLSGGMGQRVMIAMMLIAEPDLLIADEPTSALDVTVQNEVLRILDDLVRERGMGLIFISHNLTMVSSFCDRVLIMYGGRIVEECAAKDLQNAQHPYTRALVAATPSLDVPRPELATVVRDPAWLA